MKRLMMTTAVALLPVAAPAQMNDAQFMTEIDAMNVRASDFIGMRVYTSENGTAEAAYAGAQTDWNDIGEINDVVMNRDGEIEAVLVDIGGFLGIGERHVAVDMDAIRFAPDSSTETLPHDFFLVMNASQSDIENAPEYAWGQIDLNDAGAELEQAAETAAANVQQTGENIAQAAEDTAADVKAAGQEVAEKVESATEQATGAVTTGAAEISSEMEQHARFGRDGYASVEKDALTTEMLTGAGVYDANDKWIGEVSELQLGNGGAIEATIVDVGGFLGLGEKPVRLSMDDLDILRSNSGDDLRVYVSMTEAELENMPSHDS